MQTRPSLDSQIIAGASLEDVFLWNLTASNILKSYSFGPSRYPCAVDTCPDKRTVVIAIREYEDDSDDAERCVLAIWDTASNYITTLFSIEAEDIIALKVINGGTQIMFATELTVFIATIESRQIEVSYPNMRSSTIIKIAEDGSYVVSITTDERLVWWNLKTQHIFKTVTGFHYYISEKKHIAALSPDEQQLLLLSEDHTQLLLHNVETLALIKVFDIYEDDAVFICLFFLPDGKRAISASDSVGLTLWDLDADTHNSWWKSKDQILDVKLLESNLQAVVLFASGGVGLVDLTTLSILHMFVDDFTSTTTPISFDVAKNDDVVLIGYQDGTLALWELTSGKLLNAFRDEFLPVQTVRIMEGGTRAVSSSEIQPFPGDYIVIWDLQTGQSERRLLTTADTILETLKRQTYDRKNKEAIDIHIIDSRLEIWLNDEIQLATFTADAFFIDAQIQTSFLSISVFDMGFRRHFLSPNPALRVYYEVMKDMLDNEY